MSKIIFSIETSCDETSVAILNQQCEILSHLNYTQKDHKVHGGVVPEIAARAHLQILQKIIPISLKKAKLRMKDIDIFCATCGPGLIGGLLVGSSVAKSMAIAQNKPFYPINHLEAHILSPGFKFNMRFPNLTVLLTGGHTQLYYVEGITKYKLIGETVDDAIGESFDKVAKLLNLKFPGGPEIEKIAKSGDENKFNIPHPFKSKKNLNFSFSGIKTAINLMVKKRKVVDYGFKKDLAASFQKKIADIIEQKIIYALEFLNEKNKKIVDISIVGGVAANKKIKSRLINLCKKNNFRLIYPQNEFCGDNAAMIAKVCIEHNKFNFNSNIDFRPNPRLIILNSIKI
tara:strand:- start:685 stop:1716 length:1032 start_codon:yes stop_codon:yes gene_type:complete